MGEAGRGRSCWVYWDFTGNRLSTRSGFARCPAVSLPSRHFFHTRYVPTDKFPSPTEFLLQLIRCLTALRERALPPCWCRSRLPSLPGERDAARCWGVRTAARSEHRAPCPAPQLADSRLVVPCPSPAVKCRYLMTSWEDQEAYALSAGQSA